MCLTEIPDMILLIVARDKPLAANGFFGVSGNYGFAHIDAVSGVNLRHLIQVKLGSENLKWTDPQHGPIGLTARIGISPRPGGISHEITIFPP